MNTGHLDARAITQPGGLYAGINDGLLESLKAYFAFKDRQQQGERQMVRDERVNGRQQKMDAITLASQLGVRSGQEDTGWMSPSDQAAIDAALAERQRKLGIESTDRSRRLTREDLETATGRVHLQHAKDQAVWDSPVVRAGRGVAGWAGDMMQEAVKAAGRAKEPKPVPGMNGAQIMLRDLDLAEQTGQPYMGENNTAVPVEKIPAFRNALQQWVAAQGGQVGGPHPVAQSPATARAPQGVDTNDRPVAQGPVTSTDQLQARAKALPAPDASVLKRNAQADYDQINRRGVTTAATPEELRALYERSRMRRGMPSMDAATNIRPTDSPAEIIAAYVAVHGGTPASAEAALKNLGIIK
jgi:hypothetical protein